MFIFEKLMPNGALAKYHKAIRFEIHPDATHAVVNSYHNEQMDMISWQDTYIIPILIKIENIQDVETVLISDGGPFAGGIIVADEEATLEAKKARVKAAVKVKRDQAVNSGVTTAYGVVDSDLASQNKLLNVFSAPSITEVEWRMKDNTLVKLDRNAMSEIIEAIAYHNLNCQANKNRLDGLIDAAENEEVLYTIDLESGW